jgi:hypothetical protein
MFISLQEGDRSHKRGAKKSGTFSYWRFSQGDSIAKRAVLQTSRIFRARGDAAQKHVTARIPWSSTTVGGREES